MFYYRANKKSRTYYNSKALHDACINNGAYRSVQYLKKENA